MRDKWTYVKKIDSTNMSSTFSLFPSDYELFLISYDDFCCRWVYHIDAKTLNVKLQIRNVDNDWKTWHFERIESIDPINILF